jgi:hypothetical protein
VKCIEISLSSIRKFIRDCILKVSFDVAMLAAIIAHRIATGKS